MVSGPVKFIAAFALYLGVNPTWAQETCAIRGAGNSYVKCLTEACSTEERTRSIQFPDGRVMWVIGHDHTKRNELMDQLLQLEEKNVSGAEGRKILSEILTENSIAVQNAQLDIEFLKHFLFTKPRSVIGVEAVNDDISDLREALNRLRQYFASQQKFTNHDRQNSEVVLLTIFGPQLYLESTQLGLFRGASLRGFESPQAVQKARDAEERQQSAYDALLKKNNTDPEILSKLVEARRDFILLAENYDPKKDNQAVLNSFRTANWSVSNEHKAEILEWVKLELELLNARRNRDRAVAERMGRSKRNQLFIVGSMHLNSLARLLREECLKELKRGTTRMRQPISLKSLPSQSTSGTEGGTDATSQR